MAFDFELLEEQDPARDDEEHCAPDQRPQRPSPAPPRPRAPLLRDVLVRLTTPGAGLVAELRLPASTTAAALKERVHELLGLQPAEQRLAVGTSVLGSDAQLQELPEALNGEIYVTVVHVPCAARVALSGCRDGTMKLWDLDAQAELSEFPGCHGPVFCVAVDWPGRRALAGGEDCCLHLWDLERKLPVRELVGHKGRVNALVADWSAGLAMSASSDNTLRLWDIKTGTSVQELHGHGSPVLCVDFDPHLSAAISGSADCCVRVWDLETGVATQEIQGHHTAVTCVVADLGGHFALTGSFATLRMWDLRGYAWHSDLAGHTAEVTCLAVHWPTRRALSGSADSTLRLWCPSSGSRDHVPIFFNAARPFACTAVLQAQHRVTCLAADWDAGRAVSGGHTGVVQVWDLDGGRLLVQLSGHLGGGVLCLASGPVAARGRPAAAGEDELARLRAARLEESLPINPFFG